MRPGASLLFTPHDLGLNGVTVTSTPRNSNAFGADGCNQLAIDYQYVYAAGTTLSFQLQSSRDNFTTTNVVATESMALGAGTMYDHTHSDGDTLSASQNKRLFFEVVGEIGVNYRIGAITCTGGTTDSLTMSVSVGRTF